MLAVIFEVYPNAAGREAYLRIAAELREFLQDRDGFISIERFQSLVHPEKILSLSYWRDENAVQAWRNVAEHRQAQQDGRAGIFSDYRLRIAGVIREYGMHDRAQAPDDSKALHG